jgi:hypothetical protein
MFLNWNPSIPDLPRLAGGAFPTIATMSYAVTVSSQQPRLRSEQRRALALLASSRPGVNAALLVYGHGFKRGVLGGLVRRGLAAAEHEVVMGGDKAVEVVRIRITEAGRRAIGSEHT